jgi:hypothetical protein
VKAGVDPNLPVAKYFMKGYEGELTAEAIREAAIEAQIVKDTQAEQVQSEAGVESFHADGSGFVKRSPDGFLDSHQSGQNP